MREQRQEYKQVKRDKEWENNGKVNGGTTIGENDLTIGEEGNKESLWA